MYKRQHNSLTQRFVQLLRGGLLQRNVVGVLELCPVSYTHLKALSDFERIGDHALNLVESAEELKSKNLALSDAARHELNVLLRAVEEIVDMTFQAFRDDDLEKAYRVEPLEQVIDDLKEKMRIHHILRMQQGSCCLLYTSRCV